MVGRHAIPILALGAALLVSCDGAGAPAAGGDALRTPWGAWRADASGRPVFRYDGPVTAPQLDAGGLPTVPRHLFGNDAWSAEAAADGRVRLFQRSGGPMWLGLGAAGSGWGLLDCGAGVAEMRRGAGAAPGSLEFAADRVTARQTTADGVTVTQVLAFPAGREFALRRRTAIAAAVGANCRFTEVWDLTPEPLTLEPLLGAAAVSAAAVARAAWNDRYRFFWSRGDQDVTLDIALAAGSDVGEPDFGPYPRRIRLRFDGAAEVALAGGADDAARAAAVPLTPAPRAFRPPFVLLVRRAVAGPLDSVLRLQPAVAAPARPDPVPASVVLDGDQVPAWWSRELRWHGAQLPANANWDGFYRESFVDQGSAYLYMQGGSGAVRDLVLNALGLLAVRPDLAAANLRTAMQWTDAAGHTYYLGHGYGGLSDVAIRDESTDLDLFLTWGIAAYLTATRDRGFLDEVVPFAGGGTGTVAARLKLGVRHLLERTGTGDNGWVRVGSGDWSDGVLLFSPDFDLTRARGESFYNTAMAAAVLPGAIDWLGAIDPVTAATAADWLDRLRAAADRGWRGDWYVRGSFGNGEFLGEDRPFLESNLWALRARLGDADRLRVLQRALYERLDADEPIGARNVYPPSELAGAFLVPGWDVNGGTWAALQGLLPGAYAQADSAAAWASLLESSMQRHAEVYPGIWYGIWNGPDSYNAAYAERPGETFVHLATPMISYPAANMNVHAGPLIAMRDLVGLGGGGSAALALDPRLPFAAWHYRDALVDIAWSPRSVDLAYLGAAAGSDRWRVRLPAAWGGRACAGAVRAHEAVPVERGWALVPLAAPIRLLPCAN